MNMGYADAQYAASMAEYGDPLHLPHCDGWLMRRAILDTPHFDAMGCYPLFACRRWEYLGRDLNALGESNDLVSVSAVIDPFASIDIQDLQAAFPDIVMPFKNHYIVNLKVDPLEQVSAHHRRNARKALSQLDVSMTCNPVEYLSTWVSLYAELIDRHIIRDHRAFSPRAFRMQLAMPSMVATIARYRSEIVAMALWITDGDVVDYHLGASSAVGYGCNATYALFWTAINYFAENGYAWVNLGGGAGLRDSDTDGLSRFKRGWATDSRIAYFCGRVYQPSVYQVLCARSGAPASGYFPGYRSPGGSSAKSGGLLDVSRWQPT
jgi:hypothetical protein